jgi:SHS2 domain-containing protein
MKFNTNQASALKSAFEVLKDILNDVNMYFTDKGVQILTLDTARVALVDMFLDAKNFEEYYCEANMVAGVNVTNMFKLLKFISNNDTLTVEIKSREYLDIRIENTTKKSDTRFQLKLLDINEDQIEVPDIIMAVTTTMPTFVVGRTRYPVRAAPEASFTLAWVKPRPGAPLPQGESYLMLPWKRLWETLTHDVHHIPRTFLQAQQKGPALPRITKTVDVDSQHRCRAAVLSAGDMAGAHGWLAARRPALVRWAMPSAMWSSSSSAASVALPSYAAGARRWQATKCSCTARSSPAGRHPDSSRQSTWVTARNTEPCSEAGKPATAVATTSVARCAP